jgi:bifunctional non-homologous end joining protein LigD
MVKPPSTPTAASRATTLPKITPIKLVERTSPFDDTSYLFELKYDGFRAVAYIDNGNAKLLSRRGNAYKRFDDLCAGIASAVKVKDAIVDGEIVCLDDAGVPRFDRLLHRRHPPSFVAFDLMWLNGRDYRNKPLLNRKKALRKIIPSSSPFVLYADFVIEQGMGLFRAACERDLEGIIAKRTDEPYADTVRWVKVENSGYTQAVGRGEVSTQKSTVNRVDCSGRSIHLALWSDCFLVAEFVSPSRLPVSI